MRASGGRCGRPPRPEQHRAAAFPTLGLVLLALVLALLHSGATSSEIIHYQIAPGGDLCPGLSNPSGAALHRFDPGRPTQLARAYPGQSVICTLEQQTPPATGNGRDFRTGARFLDHDQDQNLGLLSTCRETSSLATDELIAFQGVTPSPEGPCHVGFGNNRMCVWSSTNDWQCTTPTGVSKYLGHRALTQTSLQGLFLAQNPAHLMLFESGNPTPLRTLPAPSSPPARAILSPSGSIYVWSGTSLRVFFPGGSPSLAFKDITPVQASILDVAVLPLDAQSPDGLVLLLSNGQVRIYPKATADALGGSASFQLTLPSGMGPDFCLIAPMRSEFPQASQTRPPWIHVVHTVEGQLFQLSLDFTHPQAVALSEVALPPNAEQATSLRPFQLLDSQGQAIWGLANRKLYLPSSIFSLNNSDQSIRCDDATSEAKHDDGYTCQDSRERALFARDQALCSACALGRRFTDSRHACSACPDHCDVCSDTTCLVCESGLHLVVHPSTGDTTCEEECANIDLAVDDLPPDGRCLPAVPDSSPETGDDPLFPTLATTSMGLQFPNGLSVVFRSRLFPDNNQCHLRRDTSTPGDLLGITQQSNLLISIVPGPNGPTSLTTTQLPCLPILQFTIIDAVELGIAGGPALVLMCMANGSTLSMRFACSGTSAGASVCPVATPVPFNLSISNCRSLRRLAADLATVLTDDGTVYFLSLPGPNSSLEVRPAAGLPGMHGHPTWLPGVPESNTPGHTPWLLFGQDDQAPHPAGTLAGHAHPLDLLLAGDSRLQVGMGQRALARPADTLANFEALTLGPAPGEVFLSGLRLADGQVVWQAAHLPAGSHWHGRSTGIPSNLEALGTLPGSSTSVPSHRVLPVDLPAPAEPPSLGYRVPGLLVLRTAGHVGLSALLCHPSTGACWLQAARFLPAPESLLDGLSVAVFAAHASGIAGAGMLATPPDPGILVVHVLLASPDEQSQPVMLSMALDLCLEGTHGPACAACHPACASCTGPGLGDCTSCTFRLAGTANDGQSCLASCTGASVTGFHRGTCACHDDCDGCEVQHLGPSTDPLPTVVCTACHGAKVPSVPPAIGASGCLDCHTTCAKCSVPGEALACTECFPGQGLLHQNECRATCPPGFRPDAASAACIACQPRCLACGQDDTCTDCVAGYFPQGPACQPCASSCAACADGAACTACQPGLVFLDPDPGVPSLCGSTCAPGEYVGAGRCAACDGSCELCAGGPDQCRVCAEGFRWAGPAPGPGGTGTCVACEPGCASCTGTACLSCAPGLLLTAAGACVSACPAGSFSNGESCQPCDISCAACAGGMGNQCTDCAAGLELVEVTPGIGTCESGCAEGQYLQGTDCLPCDAACATCNGPTDKDCWRCVGAVLQGDACAQACAAKHVAVADRCLPCHVSCDECIGTRSTECTACPGGLLALPAGQSPTRCVPACPAGHHTSAAGCAPCGAHCASCPEQADTCGQCERGWLLASPDCVDSCPGDTSAQGGLCITCHASCAACFGPGPGQCAACLDPAHVLANGTCQASCPEGSFASAGACQPCAPTCATCDGPSTSDCATCPGDRLFLQGACLAECPQAHYHQPADQSGHECAPCDASCLQCSGPGSGQCSACPPGSLLHQGTCVPLCPGGFFACLAAGQCAACPGGCATCQAAPGHPGGTCQADCLTCLPGGLLAGHQCLEACPLGTFAPAESAICQPCAAPCDTCAGRGDHCTSCLDGLLLLPGAGSCAGSCPAGTAAILAPARACLACPANCAQCDATASQPGCSVAADGSLTCPAIPACSQCDASFLLLAEATCTRACPAGTFADWAASPAACAACQAGCTECTGPAKEDCLRSAGPSSRGLALGLGIGLGLLMLLLLLVALLVLLRRYRRAAKPGGMDHDDEDATVMNTIVELSLPGSILVSIANDFSPLNEDALGAGTQASVYAARAVGAGISDRLGCPGTVAIKQLKAARMTPAQVTLFQNEVALMWLLRDAPNVVRLYGYSDQPPAIVMERYQTDLATLLHSDVPLDQGTILDIAQQWASGLEAMHAHGIAHRDLKPANVFASLLDSGAWSVALGDLGTSQNLSTDRSSALVTTAPELNAMTARYAAPEVLVAFRRRRPLEPSHLSAADIFSAAVLLWESLSRAIPWEACNFEQISAAVQAGDRPDVSTAVAPLGAQAPNLGQMAADLLARAWNQDPLARPPAATFRQVCASMAVFSSGQ